MIKELQMCLYEAINSMYDTSIDKLNVEFDFTNIGCFFTLNSPQGSGNRNTFTLQVYLISQQSNKLDMQDLAENIDKAINNKPLNCNALVRHDNIWFNEFIDNDKLQNIVMTYKVDQF